MKTKRIFSYVTITTLCAVACCVIEAFLIFQHNAFAMRYVELLRPLVPFLAALVLVRHYALLYHLRLMNKPWWINALIIVALSCLLLVVLYVFTSFERFMMVNHPFWNDPIPYSVFFKREFLILTEDYVSLPNWVSSPILLLLFNSIYLFAHETKFGRYYLLNPLSFLYTSPFFDKATGSPESTGETQDDENSVEEYIRQIVRDELEKIVVLATSNE